jgi:hypothetical protein
MRRICNLRLPVTRGLCHEAIIGRQVGLRALVRFEHIVDSDMLRLCKISERKLSTVGLGSVRKTMCD